MIIGYDVFKGRIESTVFDDARSFSKIQAMDIQNVVLDEVYLDKDISLPYSKDKPSLFLVSTIINAKLKGNLEAGNLQLDGIGIQDIGVQKRKIGTTEWIDVGKIKYTSHTDSYNILDRNIEFDQEYEYCIFPLSNGLVGVRNISDSIKTHFEGAFISDKDNNFHFLSNCEISDMNETIPSKVHESMYSKYPIVTYGSMRYTTFNFTGWYISSDALESGKINIGYERQRQENLLNWLRNGKPKIFRDHNGVLKVVSVVDAVTVSPKDSLTGGFTTTFSLVEIGSSSDNSILTEYGLIQG